MKLKKIKFVSILIITVMLISCTSDDTLESDSEKVIPNITNINGETVAYEGDILTYQISPYRGGSEYIWTVNGAEIQPIQGRTDKINILFNQFEEPVSVSVYERAANGLVSETLTLNISVFGTPCDWDVVMDDSWGDGWNGAYLIFTFEGIVIGEITLDSGSNGIETVAVPDGGNLDVQFTSGQYDSEITYQIFDGSGNLVFSDGPSPTTGEVFSTFNSCP